MRLALCSALILGSSLACAAGEPPPAPAGKTCCCKLTPTDGEDIKHRMTPTGQCTGNGPEGHYDSAVCVDGDFCQE